MPRMTASRLIAVALVCALILCLVSTETVAAQSDTVPDTLAQRISACAACHGKHGEGGNNGYYPRVAGKPALYLYRQLLNFRSGRRNNPMMEHMVTGLSDTYLSEIAHYYSSLASPHRKTRDMHWPVQMLARGQQLVRHGDPQRKVPACEACHGSRLTGVEPATPALLGLPNDYISAQLGAWNSHTRSAVAPDCMATIASRLDENDILAVAAWLASQPLPVDASAVPDGSVDPPLECGSLAP